MTTDTSRQIAVLTGDLVASTGASRDAVEQAMHVLAMAAAETEAMALTEDSRFTRSRGDGWQMLITRPEYALRAMLVMAARLRSGGPGLASRIALGIGASVSIGSQDLADAAGPAFEMSGRGLDAMPTRQKLAVSGDGIAGLHHAVLRLVEDRASAWSREQAEAVANMLPPSPPTLARVANRLGISPQAVEQRLRAAGWPALRDALRGWEDQARAVTATGEGP